jgi:quinol monooxygenase YgiN
MSSTPVASQPFYQYVSLVCKDSVSRDKLREAWIPLFNFVKDTQIPTGVVTTYGGYFPLVGGDKDQADVETEMVAFEAYTSEDHCYNKHMNTDTFKTFFGSITSQGLLAGPPLLRHLTPSGQGFHTRGAEKEAEARANGKIIGMSVILKFKDEAGLQAFRDILKPLTQYTKDNEPQTLSYEHYTIRNSPLELMIFERYRTLQDLTELHWKSDAFKTYAAANAKLGVIVGKEKRMYNQLNKGVWGPQ